MVFRVIVLDSSFLVSLFLPHDENHARALGLFEKHRSDEMLVTDIILFETLTVLNYKAGVEFAKNAYGQMVANRKLQVVYLNEAERREILEDFFAQKEKMSMEDVSIIRACRKTLSTVLSFDKKLVGKIRKTRAE